MQKQIINFIGKYGWSAIGVFPEPETNNPGFTYTTGFEESYLHPEIIIVGLPDDVCHTFLGAMAEQIKKGVHFKTDTVYDDLANLPVTFVEVSKKNRDKYLCQTGYYYEDKGIDFTALQLIWSDTLGVFPYEAGFEDKFKAMQPMLNK